MENETIEMVILLNGNFVPLEVPKVKMEECEQSLVDAIKQGINDPLYFWRQGNVTVFTKSVVGWYFRYKPQSQADKMINFLEKNMGGGDEWKTED